MGGESGYEESLAAMGTLSNGLQNTGYHGNPVPPHTPSTVTLINSGILTLEREGGKISLSIRVASVCV